VGQMVKKGQPLGQCGNSGRSPYPHLHMQLQMHPFAGAASIRFKFANLLIDAEQGGKFLHRGMLYERQVVRNLPGPGPAEEFFPYSSVHEHVYDMNGKTEVWQLQADLAGQFYLETFPEKSRADFQRDGSVIRFTAFSGSRQTGLYFFVKYFRELPLAREATMTWTASVEPEPVLTSLQRLAFLLVLFGLRPVRRIGYALQADQQAIRLEAKPVAGLAFCRWAVPFPGGAEPSVRLLLAKGRGVQQMTRGNSCLELKEIRPINQHL